MFLLIFSMMFFTFGKVGWAIYVSINFSIKKESMILSFNEVLCLHKLYLKELEFYTCSKVYFSAYFKNMNSSLEMEVNLPTNPDIVA